MMVLPKEISEVIMFGSLPVKRGEPKYNYWKMRRLMRKAQEHQKKLHEHIQSHREIYIMYDLTCDQL
jgi:hypothetical protein